MREIFYLVDYVQIFWRIYFNIVEKFHFWILLKPLSTSKTRTIGFRISRGLGVDVISYEFNRKYIHKISSLFNFRCKPYSIFKTEKFVFFFLMFWWGIRSSRSLISNYPCWNNILKYLLHEIKKIQFNCS